NHKFPGHPLLQWTRPPEKAGSPLHTNNLRAELMTRARQQMSTSPPVPYPHPYPEADMFAFRSLRRPGRRTALAAGVLGAALTLLAGTAGSSVAAPPPDPDRVRVTPGQAYMGVGIKVHQGLPAARDSLGVLAPTDGVQGIDVSHWQGAINWTSVRNAGIQFAWIKATEGTS